VDLEADRRKPGIGEERQTEDGEEAMRILANLLRILIIMSGVLPFWPRPKRR
jgi:hypothetical protein